MITTVFLTLLIVIIQAICLSYIGLFKRRLLFAYQTLFFFLFASSNLETVTHAIIYCVVYTLISIPSVRQKNRKSFIALFSVLNGFYLALLLEYWSFL